VGAGEREGDCDGEGEDEDEDEESMVQKYFGNKDNLTFVISDTDFE